MKRFLFLSLMSVASLALAAEMGASPTWPYFGEVQKGAWTMNYEGALAQARLDGSPVFLLFTGSMWCPHCKEMNANIFSQQSWKDRVKDAYLVQLDFPRRDEGVDTLLKNADYLAAAGLTAEQGLSVLARNWQLHAFYTLPGGTRVSFPTVVVLGSDGTVRGRFSDHDKTATYDALPVVLEILDELLGQGGNEADSFYPGSILLPEPPQPGVAVTNSPYALGASDSDDWYRFTPAASNAAAWTFTLAQADATNGTVTLSLYKNPALPPVASVRQDLSESPTVACFPASFETNYFLRVSAGGLTNLLNYALIYHTDTTNAWQGLAEVMPESLRVARTDEVANVSVRIRRFGAAGAVSARVLAAEISPSEALNGVHFGVVTNVFELPEGQSEATFEMSVPIYNPQPDVWRGDKSFKVVVDSVSNGMAAATLTVVTIAETRARNAGVVAFSGFGPATNVFPVPAVPAFNAVEGSRPAVWVTRSGGSDGAVTATVSYPLDGQTVNKLLTWNAGETGPKSVSLYMPGPALPAQVRTIVVTLKNELVTPILPATAGKITLTVTPTGTPAFVGNATAYVLATSVNRKIFIPVTNALPGVVSAKVVAGKLPAGTTLAMSAGNVLLSGEPRNAGVYTVSVLLSVLSGGAAFPGEVRTFALTVLPIGSINKNPQGTYQGILSGKALRGTFVINARANGALTVQLKSHLGQNTLSAKAWTDMDPASGSLFLSLSRNGVTLDLEVSSDGLVDGRVVLSDGSKTAASGEKSAAFADALVQGIAGYYTVALRATHIVPGDAVLANAPAGSGYLTVRIDSRMMARYSGKLGDGTSISGSAPCLRFHPKMVSPTFVVPVVAPLYGRRGSATALLVINTGADLEDPSDNEVGVLGSSWIYPGKSLSATADRFTGRFDDGYGAYYGTSQALADYYAGSTLGFGQPLGALEVGFLEISANGLSLGVASANPSGVSLSASAVTGLFKGHFVAETDAGEHRSVSFMGVLVPGASSGEGYFLYPDATWRTIYNLKRSYFVGIQ